MTNKIELNNGTIYEFFIPQKVSLEYSNEYGKNDWFINGVNKNTPIKFEANKFKKLNDVEVKGINFIRPLTNRYYGDSLNIILDTYDKIIEMEFV